MSKITVENLRISSESADRSVRGVAGAWALFDTTAGSILQSSNISSYFDVGVGRAHLYYTNSLSSQPAIPSGGYWNANVTLHTLGTLDRVEFATHNVDPPHETQDITNVSVSVFGDLA